MACPFFARAHALIAPCGLFGILPNIPYIFIKNTVDITGVEKGVESVQNLVGTGFSRFTLPL